jgi:hypothetical protein
VLDRDIEMDDPMQIPLLTKAAYSFDLGPTVRWLRERLFAQSH